MFIPLYDGVGLKYVKRAAGTFAIIGFTSAFSLLALLGAFGDFDRMALGLGLIPALVTDRAVLSDELVIVPAYVTTITALFLHGGIFHLLVNMLFLWVFGDNVEDAMGTIRFIFFYLACGIVSGAAHVLMFPASPSPLVGASGAISGVAAAYLILYPRVSVFGLVLNWIPVFVPAVILIGLWIVYQVTFAVMDGGSNIGWWAHLGGILAGAVFVPIFKRKAVPLFGPRTS